MIKEKKFYGEVVCDSMTNEGLYKYNAHPERLCIIIDGIVVHQGGNGPLLFYDVKGIREWLEDRFKSELAAAEAASHEDDAVSSCKRWG